MCIYIYIYIHTHVNACLASDSRDDQVLVTWWNTVEKEETRNEYWE